MKTVHYLSKKIGVIGGTKPRIYGAGLN